MIGMTIEELRKWVMELWSLKYDLENRNRELYIENQELRRKIAYLSNEGLSEEECADRYYESKRWC